MYALVQDGGREERREEWLHRVGQRGGRGGEGLRGARVQAGRRLGAGWVHGAAGGVRGVAGEVLGLQAGCRGWVARWVGPVESSRPSHQAIG